MRRTLFLWALCLTGCSTTVSGVPTADRTDGLAYRDGTVNDLPQLLLEPDEVDDILGTAHMTVSDTAERAVALDPGQTVTGDANCLGVAFSGMATTYRSGYLTALGQRLADPGDAAAQIVFQFVAIYPSSDGAERFVTESEVTWTTCAGNSVSVKQSNTVTDTWRIGAMSTSDGIASVVNLQEGGDGWACSRSLGARANVVVDVAACGEDVTAGTSATLAGEIVAKVPE